MSEVLGSTAEALPAGWAKPAQAKKFHYFPQGEITALCKHWMMGNGWGDAREDSDDDHKENCAGCRAKVKKLRATK